MAPPRLRGPIHVTAIPQSVPTGVRTRSLPLGPGDKAPPLHLAKFVHGESLDGLQEGHVYVIEFWATWCGSCQQTLPYVAELQNQNSDDVTVIGVTAEDEQTVMDFLDGAMDEKGTWGDVLGFRIALDNQRKTQKAWLETSKDEGLPFAMIVGRTGVIEWKGHPAKMGRPLRAIINGDWDHEVARELMRKEVEGQRSIDGHQQAIVTAVNAGNYREAVGITDRMMKSLPDNRKILSLQKQLMLEGKMFRRMNTVLAKLVELHNEDPTELNAIAWDIAVEPDLPERDLDLALKAATLASELTNAKNSSILDTVARVHYERGELLKAIEWQEKAVSLQPDAQQLTDVLEEYRIEAVGAASEEDTGN